MNTVPTVLSDAGPLIALGKLNRLELLADLYRQVQIPRAVYSEVVTQGLARGVSEALTVRLFWQGRNWPVLDVPSTTLADYVPPVTLGPGETEVLALAQTLTNPFSRAPSGCPLRALRAAGPTARLQGAPGNIPPHKFETGTKNHEGLAGTTAAINYLADLGAEFGAPFAEQYPEFEGRRLHLKTAMAAIRAYERPLAS